MKKIVSAVLILMLPISYSFSQSPELTIGKSFEPIIEQLKLRFKGDLDISERLEEISSNAHYWNLEFENQLSKGPISEDWRIAQNQYSETLSALWHALHAPDEEARSFIAVVQADTKVKIESITGLPPSYSQSQNSPHPPTCAPATAIPVSPRTKVTIQTVDHNGQQVSNYNVFLISKLHSMMKNKRPFPFAKPSSPTSTRVTPGIYIITAMSTMGGSKPTEVIVSRSEENEVILTVGNNGY